MFRRFIGSMVVAALLASGSTAFAASNAAAHRGASASAAGQVQSGTQTGGSGPSGHAFGLKVRDAVQAALASGSTGTALANAVHEVLVTEHANAKGLQVAMAVYAKDTSNTSPTTPFTDLPTQAPWALSAVAALHNAGVIEGTSATTFSPSSNVTVDELATMLARLQAVGSIFTSGAPGGTPSWALSAMNWAASAGVMNNEQGLGGPSAALTRAQAIVMLLNAAGLGQAAAMDANVPITLQGNAPSWAHGALALAIQLGLLQGANGQLLANSPLTRAQMAVVLARLAVLQAQSNISSGTSSGSTGSSTSTNN